MLESRVIKLDNPPSSLERDEGINPRVSPEFVQGEENQRSVCAKCLSTVNCKERDEMDQVAMAASPWDKRV